MSARLPRNIAHALVALTAGTLGLATGAGADSIFSSVGFGRWMNTVDVRSAGMGDVSLAAPAPYGFSVRNPGMLAVVAEATGYVGVQADFTRSDTGVDSDTRPDSRVRHHLRGRLRGEDAHPSHRPPLLARDLPLVLQVCRRSHETSQADILVPALHVPYSASSALNAFYQRRHIVAQRRDCPDTRYDHPLQLPNLWDRN